MRVAGAWTVIAGLLLAAIFALLPVDVAVLGTTRSCGLPVRAAFTSSGSTAETVRQQCTDESRQRLLVGGVAGGIAVLGGALMLLTRPKPRPVTAGYVPGDWWWNGRIWVPTRVTAPPPGYRGPWYSGSLYPPTPDPA